MFLFSSLFPFHQNQEHIFQTHNSIVSSGCSWCARGLLPHGQRVLSLTFLTWARSLCAPSSTWPPRPALGERCTVSVTTRRAQVTREAYRQLVSDKQGSELGRGLHLSSLPVAGLGVQDDAETLSSLSA